MTDTVIPFGKAAIIDALQEAGKAIAPAWLKPRKKSPVAIAEREMAATGWLPQPLWKRRAE